MHHPFSAFGASPLAELIGYAMLSAVMIGSKLAELTHKRGRL